MWDQPRGPRTHYEIADALYLSRETIKTQVRSIYRKLGVSSRRGALALLEPERGLGLLPEPGS